MGIIAYFPKNYELMAPSVNLEVYYVQTFKTIGLHFYDGNKFFINHNILKYKSVTSFTASLLYPEYNKLKIITKHKNTHCPQQ